jgi:methylated-DNA-[protein]-cysteine S-methyltransferase
MTVAMYYTITSSPVGTILLLATDQGLAGLYLETSSKPHKVPENAARSDRYFTDIVQQLDEYFAGKRQEFDVQLDLEGTSFQKSVWQELYKIPFGTVISYKELARRIGKPAACRAVGTANGRNPISIIIPCHRVIAADGSLGGYGWGLECKRQLLQLEKVLCQN